MPGRLFLTRPAEEIAAALGVPVPPQEPRLNIAPGQEILVLTPEGPQMMRWGMIPVGRVNARGRPVMETIVNARSETVFDKSAFSGVGRGIVPVDGWYEWTGEKRKKTAWAIRPKSRGMLFFAAITDNWTAPGGRVVPQVATITCEPNADVKSIHHRMGVLLTPNQFDTWFNGTEGAAIGLMKPYLDGSLEVSEASGVDWSGA